MDKMVRCGGIYPMVRHSTWRAHTYPFPPSRIRSCKPVKAVCQAKRTAWSGHSVLLGETLQVSSLAELLRGAKRSRVSRQSPFLDRRLACPKMTGKMPVPPKKIASPRWWKRGRNDISGEGALPHLSKCLPDGENTCEGVEAPSTRLTGAAVSAILSRS